MRNSCPLADDILEHFLGKKYIWISVMISLKIIPMGRTDSMLALDNKITWHRTGNEPLCEPMVI